MSEKSITAAMPVDQTRRRFLSTAAGIAAGGAALALAIPPASAAADPVFALIDAHRAADVGLLAVLAEQVRLEALGHEDADVEVGTGAAHAVEWDAMADLIDAVPVTLAGVMASLTYINGLAETDPWRFEGDGVLVTLLANLGEALQSLA
jgi:hypothetical protein